VGHGSPHRREQRRFEIEHRRRWDQPRIAPAVQVCVDDRLHQAVVRRVPDISARGALGLGDRRGRFGFPEDPPAGCVVGGMYDRRSERDRSHHESAFDREGGGGAPGKRTLAELWPAAPVAARAQPAAGHDEPASTEERADEEDLAGGGEGVAPVADQGGGDAGGDEDGGGDDGGGGEEGDGGESAEDGEEPPAEAAAADASREPPPRREGTPADAASADAAPRQAGGQGPAPAPGPGPAPAPGPGPAPAPGPAPGPAPAPIAANLTVPNATLELLDTLQLSLAGGGAGATYRFEIKRARGSSWNTLQDGAASTYAGLARIAGRFKVRGTVTAGGRSQVSAEQSVQVRFPRYSRIVADATVASATRRAWRNTLAATTPTARREEGFWIRINTAGAGAYQVTSTATGPVVGPGTGATINLPAKPPDTPGAPRLDGSAVYTVASFHTHTPTTYRAVPRVVGPSGTDRSADRADNVAGVVYDYVATTGNSIPPGHPLNGRARRYRSRDRRSTPG
jgi:hypothetical protein